MAQRYTTGRSHYFDEAYVLNHYDFGEADQVIVLITAEHGLVRAVAKGIRKARSRFGARLGKFTKVSVQIYPSHSLATLGEVSTVASYSSKIVSSVEKYYAAISVLELVEILSRTVESSEVFPLLDSALQTIADEEIIPPRSIADQAVLRLLSQAGWEPALVDCAQCGEPGPHQAFQSEAGGAVCAHCRPPGSLTPEPEVVRALWWLLHGHNDSVRAVFQEQQKYAERVFSQAHALLKGYAQYHLETGMKTFHEL